MPHFGEIRNLPYPYDYIVQQPDPTKAYYEAWENLGNRYRRSHHGSLGAPVVQAAIDAASALGGGRVLIKDIIDVASTIYLENDVHLAGLSKVNSGLRASAVMDKLLSFEHVQAYHMGNVQDLRLEGNALADKTIYGAPAQVRRRLILDNLYVRGAVTTIFDATWLDALRASNCIFEGTDNPTNPTTAVTPNGIVVNNVGGNEIFDKCIISSCLNYEAIITDAEHMVFSKCSFSHITSPTLYHALLKGSENMTTFDKCWFETASDPQNPFLYGDATVAPDQVNIDNCRFIMHGGTKPFIGGLYNRMNIFGGKMKHDGTATYCINAQIASLTAFGFKATLPINYTPITAFRVYHTGDALKESNVEKSLLSPTFTIDSVGMKTVTIPHLLPTTPVKKNIVLTPVSETAVEDWRYNLLKVYSVDATNIIAKIYVVTASLTAGATAKLAAHVLT